MSAPGSEKLDEMDSLSDVGAESLRRQFGETIFDVDKVVDRFCGWICHLSTSVILLHRGGGGGALVFPLDIVGEEFVKGEDFSFSAVAKAVGEIAIVKKLEGRISRHFLFRA